MSTNKLTDTILGFTAEEVPRISEAERAELLASLEEGRADVAAGNYHVLQPGMLRIEFGAILEDDLSDDELDALLGITPQPPR